jgi:hypothetical protein
LIRPSPHRLQGPYEDQESQDEARQRQRSDFGVDPGIGTSTGTTISGEDRRDLEDGSSFEGDVMNHTMREGGVDPNRTGRTNT